LPVVESTIGVSSVWIVRGAIAPPCGLGLAASGWRTSAVRRVSVSGGIGGEGVGRGTLAFTGWGLYVWLNDTLSIPLRVPMERKQVPSWLGRGWPWCGVGAHCLTVRIGMFMSTAASSALPASDADEMASTDPS